MSTRDHWGESNAKVLILIWIGKEIPNGLPYGGPDLIPRVAFGRLCLGT